jgi:uncharacterized protein YodC (DUF2158 family)
MSERQFKPGDVVRLKSGSHLMTVSKFEPSNSYVGVYWASDNSINGSYPAAILEEADAASGSSGLPSFSDTIRKANAAVREDRNE